MKREESQEEQPELALEMRGPKLQSRKVKWEQATPDPRKGSDQ
jgi:hypothetical protein